MRQVSIMRCVSMALSISVIMLCVILGVWTAHAESLYTTTVPFFSDGLDFETGTKHADLTVLIVVCGPQCVYFLTVVSGQSASSLAAKWWKGPVRPPWTITPARRSKTEC